MQQRLVKNTKKSLDVPGLSSLLAQHRHQLDGDLKKALFKAQGVDRKADPLAALLAAVKTLRPGQRLAREADPLTVALFPVSMGEIARVGVTSSLAAKLLAELGFDDVSAARLTRTLRDHPGHVERTSRGVLTLTPLGAQYLQRDVVRS